MHDKLVPVPEKKLPDIVKRIKRYKYCIFCRAMCGIQNTYVYLTRNTLNAIKFYYENWTRLLVLFIPVQTLRQSWAWD